VLTPVLAEGPDAIPQSPREDAGSDLLTLHRAGRLVAEYPQVGSLLKDLDGSDLVRAGQVLARLSWEEILREHPTTHAVTVVITGHGTLSPLLPPLTAQLARHGLLLRPVVSSFDSYVFDLADVTSPVYATGADLVLCVLDPMVA
jgi:hypothetical protein